MNRENLADCENISRPAGPAIDWYKLINRFLLSLQPDEYGIDARRGQWPNSNWTS